ncbi:hypothetical protein CYMTET_33524 [Cymbomonas tetramitiformis]|uniref:EGF domain-specific O-linked N-acetylglucosamine transferase n=1 Tax=Cymbomonas tetramitiformis TaxID=36881 RepID=A0AAE0FD05_9CHLO|nr:hypothetical protein CYMTET_33524 [Cymbomonas tetramitiformis]
MLPESYQRTGASRASLASGRVLSGVDEPLRVTYISRRPYATSDGQKSTARRIGNEDDLMRMLEGMAGIRAELVDFAQMDLLAQLTRISQTDILLGMHGAGLGWVVALPPHGALFELWPQQTGVWQCFEHMAEWSGLLYRRVSHSKRGNGEVTTVNVDAIKKTLNDLVPQVKMRRTEQVAS